MPRGPWEASDNSKALRDEAARLRQLAESLLDDARDIVRILHRQADMIEFNARLQDNSGRKELTNTESAPRLARPL